MYKILTYCTFVIVTLDVIIAFVTARTYPQLVVAIAFYPLLVYFAFKVFPRKRSQVAYKEHLAPIQPVAENAVDDDKRAFLKLLGVSGFSLLLYSIFIKRPQVPLSNPAKCITMLKRNNHHITLLNLLAGNLINQLQFLIKKGLIRDMS